MGGPTRVRVLGPLEEFAEGFQAELASLGYSPRTSEAQMYLLNHLSGWRADPGTAGLESAPQRPGRGHTPQRPGRHRSGR